MAEFIIVILNLQDIYCYKDIYNYYINYLNANSLKIIITNIHIDTRACTFKQGPRNELFSGEARKTSPFIYSRC